MSNTFFQECEKFLGGVLPPPFPIVTSKAMCPSTLSSSVLDIKVNSSAAIKLIAQQLP